MADPLNPPDFNPRSPWWGGDLQTLRNSLISSNDTLPGRSERLFLEMQDGSGDRLAAMLDTPSNRPAGPVVVLIHGLAGTEESPYVRASAAFHLKRGRQVLRLNLRGAGPSRQSCGGHYHAGCADDLRDALAGLERALLEDGAVLIGYSLGGNILLNLLADHELPIRAAATVSAPIEPAAAAQRFMEPRNALYHYWLLRQLKQQSTAPGARLGAGDRETIQRARTIYEFDDWFIAPRSGFAGADDYYARTAGARVACQIDVPTLMIMARDDPWIPTAAYEDLLPYCPPNLRIVLTPGGGHVGFHDSGGQEAWHDRAIDAFMRASL
jgi:hypothetical protein